MDSHRTAKSQVTAWVLAVVVVVPLLYVLTMPVVGWALTTAGSSVPARPTWLAVYALPFNWLLSTPAGPSVMRYYDWMSSNLNKL